MYTKNTINYVLYSSAGPHLHERHYKTRVIFERKKKVFFRLASADRKTNAKPLKTRNQTTLKNNTISQPFRQLIQKKNLQRMPPIAGPAPRPETKHAYKTPRIFNIFGVPRTRIFEIWRKSLKKRIEKGAAPDGRKPYKSCVFLCFPRKELKRETSISGPQKEKIYGKSSCHLHTRLFYF
jgi:hypothetical protein